jgi:hypothetical protein
MNWIESHRDIDRESMKRILADAIFQQIIEVHEQMKKQGSPNLVADYIFEFALFAHKSCLMVPYVYITGTVPQRFSRAQVGFLGFGSSLPEKMKGMGLLESCSPKKMEQLGLLETSFSERDKFQFICRFCKHTGETFAVCSMQGPFHAVSCPRYLTTEIKENPAAVTTHGTQVCAPHKPVATT